MQKANERPTSFCLLMIVVKFHVIHLADKGKYCMTIYKYVIPLTLLIDQKQLTRVFLMVQVGECYRIEYARVFKNHIKFWRTGHELQLNLIYANKVIHVPNHGGILKTCMDLEFEDFEDIEKLVPGQNCKIGKKK